MRSHGNKIDLCADAQEIPRTRLKAETGPSTFADCVTDLDRGHTLRLFLSYRRADSSHVAGRIFDKLISVYGKENVFKDVDSVPLGEDFRRVIEESVANSDLMLLVIGENWLVATDEQGRRRLEGTSDYVRLEIEIALACRTKIIPLLVEGAVMPNLEELPESLRPLVFRNAMEIRSDPDFHRDMDRLTNSIKHLAKDDETNIAPNSSKAENRNPRIQSDYRIRIESGPHAGRLFDLGHTQITMGRSEDCDVCLEREPLCSRTHCALEWDSEQGSFFVNAWHASGLVLNGQHVHGRHQLIDKDRLVVGTTEMVFELV